MSHSLVVSAIKRTVRLSARTSRRTVWTCNSLPDSEARPIRATIVVFEHGDRFIAFDDETRIGMLPGDDVTPLLQSRTVLLDNYALAPTVAALGTDVSELAIVADVEEEVESNSLSATSGAADGFARRLTAESEPAAIVDALWNDQRSTVVITDGADGVWFRDAGSANCRHQPSFEVPVVDTTGCGDVFHGAYAVALARGFDAAERVGSRQLQEPFAQPAVVAADGCRPRRHRPTAFYWAGVNPP